MGISHPDYPDPSPLTEAKNPPAAEGAPDELMQGLQKEKWLWAGIMGLLFQSVLNITGPTV